MSHPLLQISKTTRSGKLLYLKSFSQSKGQTMLGLCIVTEY